MTDLAPAEQLGQLRAEFERLSAAFRRADQAGRQIIMPIIDSVLDDALASNT